jgi:hypothetical protein
VRFRTIIIFGACGLLGLGSCKRPPSARAWVPEAVPELGAVVARVGEVPVYAAEVAEQAAHTGRSPRAALEDLIVLHLLAERLRPRWPPQDRDQEARALEREMLVQRLLERDFEAHARPQDLPEAAVRALYEAARDKFVHPRLVEVAVLVLTPGKKAPPQVRADARKTMSELAAVVALRRERTPEDLQLVGSDEKWRNRKVQFFRFLQAKDAPYSARFGAEVSKMKTPGETSSLIEDEYGFYIARYVGDRPPQNQTFEQVKDELRQGYYARWRQAKFLEFTQQLAAQHEVELHPAALTTAPGS